MKLPAHLVLTLIISFSSPSFSQVAFNPTVKDLYDSVFNKLDIRLQKMVNNPDNRMRSVVLLTTFKLDTLNKQDFLPKSEIKLTPADTGKHRGYIPERVLMPDVMVGRAKAKKDTLIIAIAPWFMLGDEIVHKISGSTEVSSYSLWQKEDKIYKAPDSHPNTNSIIINAPSRIILTERNFVSGRIIYGSAELVTDEYAQIHVPDFKNNTLKLRARYSYVFKLTTLKEDGF